MQKPSSSFGSWEYHNSNSAYWFRFVPVLQIILYKSEGLDSGGYSQYFGGSVVTSVYLGQDFVFYVPIIQSN